MARFRKAERGGLYESACPAWGRRRQELVKAVGWYRRRSVAADVTVGGWLNESTGGDVTQRKSR